MRSIVFQRALFIALSLPLGACSSILGIHFANRAPEVRPVEQAMAAPSFTASDAKTLAAREQLASGQVGLAIETFLQALSDGEARGPAVNGLGVAYAWLGRYDLARRYFEEATAVDPEDSRYAANLALALRSADEEHAQAALSRRRSAPHDVHERPDLIGVSVEEGLRHREQLGELTHFVRSRARRAEAREVALGVRQAELRAPLVDGVRELLELFVLEGEPEVLAYGQAEPFELGLAPRCHHARASTSSASTSARTTSLHMKWGTRSGSRTRTTRRT